MQLTCVNDFKMEDGEICFSAGHYYQFEPVDLDLYQTIDDQGEDHYMSLQDILGTFLDLN